MDLTPRTSSDNAPLAPRKRNARWGYVALLIVIVLAGGTIVTKFLTSAIDYYCNVDEVGVRSGCEGERRMRVQGVVEQNSVKQADGGTTFILDFNKKTLKVAYSGDPGGVFQECIPIIAHGRIINGVFESDRIEVKHSNQYVEKNAKRIDASNKEAAACSVLKG